MAIMLGFEDFSSNCKKGRCLRHTIYNETTCSREGKQRRCHVKYLDKISSKLYENKTDNEWEVAKKRVWERDGGKCRLLSILSPEEVEQAKANTGFFMSQPLDIAHCIRRSQSQKLYYEERNLYLLNRLFHSKLDSYQNPVTGRGMSREDADAWWIRIIGQEEFEWLRGNK